MNRNEAMKLTKLLVLVMALGLCVTACKTKEPPTTQLPKSGSGTVGSRGNEGPGSSGKINDTTGLTPEEIDKQGGLPFGDGHPGWNQDREPLKADTVHFDYDKSTIRADERPKVSAVADYLKGNSAAAVLIEGHCDERGTEEYNRALGERRALALREELARLGIDPKRVDTVTFGRDRPADTGHSEASHAKNRRGEFVVLTAPK